MWAMSTMNNAPTSLANLRELGEIDLARIGAGAGDDQLRLVLAGQLGDLVEVDAFVGLARRRSRRS